MLLAEQHQRCKSLTHTLQLLLVFQVGIVTLDKLLLIDEIAGIHTYLLHPLGCLHSSIGLKMNIGHERHLATGGTQLACHMLQIRGMHFCLSRQADNLTPRLCQSQSLLYTSRRIERGSRKHRLNTNRIGTTQTNIAHLHLTSQAAIVLKKIGTMEH